MWNDISDLWGNSNIAVLNNDNIILNDKSPRDVTPKDCSVKLWSHQEAMLHRVRHIEKQGYKCL
jgi:hypothetical protein